MKMAEEHIQPGMTGSDKDMEVMDNFVHTLKKRDLSMAYEVWVIDDCADMLSHLSDVLIENGYHVFAFQTARSALKSISGGLPHVIVCDICMPEMDGLGFLEEVRRVDPELPVVLATGFPDMELAVNAVKKRAFDFLVKPFKVSTLLEVVASAAKWRALELEKRMALYNLENPADECDGHMCNAIKGASLETVQVLTRIAESRDYVTGSHIKRIGLYSRLIAERLGCPRDFCDDIYFASQMHDIGKVSVPDSILLKPGPLSDDEFDVMKLHTRIGARMFLSCQGSVLKMSKEIALHHHEKRDGSGYPMGLEGEEIPFPARIAMLTDTYDALRSDRPYRRGFSHHETLDIMTNGDLRVMPGHFDPHVFNIFKDIHQEFMEIFDENTMDI